MNVRALACVLLLALAACSAGGLETATEMPTTPRRPDGVFVEPPPALPPPSDRAAASGIIALREPLADRDVEDIVRAYVRAFEREDIDALVLLLAQEAVPLGRNGNKTQLIDLWRTKMKNFEYQKLAGMEVARVTQIEKFSYDALGDSGPQSPPASRGAPSLPQRPVEMRPGDLYVRVPISTPRVGTEQLFGEVLVLLLRREDGRLRLAGQADESGS